MSKDRTYRAPKRRDLLREALDCVAAAYEDKMLGTMAEMLAAAEQPDRSVLDGLDFANTRPYGTGARLTDGAERAWRENARHLPKAERDVRSYARDAAFVRWWAAFLRNDHEEMRRADPAWARTLTTAAGGDGLVAPGYFASLVFLKERDTGRLGPMFVQLPTGDTSVRVPYEKTVATALPVTEGGDMTSGQTEPDVEALEVAPIKVGQVFTLTRELVEDSPLMVVSNLASRVAHAIGEAEDDLWLNSASGGSLDFGDAGGLIAGGTTSTSLWDDDAETLATVVAKVYELPRDVLTRARWAVNVAAAQHLSTTVDIDGTNVSDRPIMLPANNPAGIIADGLPEAPGAWGSLAGLPVFVHKTGAGGVPANTAVLFDPASIARVMRETLRLETDRGSGFVNDLIRVHVSRRVGGALMQPTHVRVYPES